MVRSLGIVAVVVGLAWTGLVGAQSSSSLEKARYINVSEQGKPPQRCKLLKTWREANGSPAFQVQAVDTGELMTIVGTAPQGAGGDPREMKTRIFRWGRDNKSPAGAPVPPPTAAASTTPPPQPVAVQKPSKTAPQPIRPAPVVAAPRPTPVPLTAQTAPVPSLVQPVATSTVLTSSKPASPAVAVKPIPVVTTKSQSLTPMGTQVIQYAPSPTPGNQLPEVPKASDSQPRLTPLAAGSVGSQNPCNCACSSPCNPCCKPCSQCGQSSCVCNTPSPMRQPLIGRLLKSNNPCPCTTVVSQPPPKPADKPAPGAQPAFTVAKTTETNDWRQSWGKVEPWKGSAQTSSVKPIEVSKRMDPKPITMEPSAQPDPLKNPAQYRDLVMSSRLTNSNIPQETRSPARPVQEAGAVNAPPNAGMPQARMVVVSADEPNAFWSSKLSGVAQEKEKLNAFDRQPETPPQSAPPAFAGPPRSGRRPLPDIPGVAIPMMPPNAPGMTMPIPPLPATAAQRGPVTMMPDAGVPNALGNAFTLPATSRPIPADFGGTPQEPNGFDPLTRAGQGTPPQGYGMGMPGGYRPQMSNMMAMGPQAQMGINPLMSVPPSYPNGQVAASVSESAPSGTVPQLLTALKDSLRPSERETAAEQLSELNWTMQPLVVESLMRAAREDPAPTVRAACVHALAHMKVVTPAAVALVREMKSDGDANVRQEAEEALHALGDSGIQQASHK